MADGGEASLVTAAAHPMIEKSEEPRVEGALREYPPQVLSALEALGIPPGKILARALPSHIEAGDLVVAEAGDDGREHLLTPAAAAAWAQLSAAARSAGVGLRIASAFRSLERQSEIIRRKLARGLSIDAILSVNAPPGFSEHHTGRAVDVATAERSALDGTFSHTEAFRWLTSHARGFGFTMSYPEGNAQGFAYEPWHWCFH